MLITLLRHADAESSSLEIADKNRALTDKGEKQVQRVAAFCQAHGLIPDRLIASPLLRAQQTAKILHKLLPACPELQTAEWLSTDSSVMVIIEHLANLANQNLDDVWLVGHEPDLSGLTASLLQSPDDTILIKKASLTRLEVDFSSQIQGKLLWSLPCSLMLVD